MAARNALLKYMRVNVSSIPSSRAPPLSISSVTQLFRRNFSYEVKGTFLDRSEVRDRVITVVKDFKKCDPSKAILDVTQFGYFKVLRKGVLPQSQTIVVKAKFISKTAEGKTKEAGGAVLILICRNFF